MAKMINVILSLKDKFSAPAKKVADSTEKISQRFTRTKKDVTKFERALNNTARNIGKNIPKIIAASTASVAGGTIAALEGTKELRNDLARLETNAKTAGISLTTASKAMHELAKFSDETDSNVEALSNLMAAGLNETQMLKALDALSGAAIKFSDTLKIEGLADGFEETLATGRGTGPFAEMIERLGYNLDDFNAGLQRAKKNGMELEYALEFLDKTGLAKIKETYEETNADLVAANQNTYAFQQRMAKLGSALQPVANRLLGITKAGQVRKNSLIDLAGRGLDHLTEKLTVLENDGTLERIGQRIDTVFGIGTSAIKLFLDNVGLITPVVAGLATGFTALNVVTKVTRLFHIANPPLLAIALAIAAVTTALVALHNNWDKITTAIGNGVQFMQDKLNGFADRLASIKVPEWLTTLSQKLANVGGNIGRALANVGSTANVATHATGTAYFAGGQTRINEGGRGEIVTLPSGTQIIPHDVSKKRSGIVQNITVHLHIAGNVLGNEQYANYIGSVIANKIKLATANM